ncbi:HAD-IIA family hydrolase [Iodobacter arcticus]|uniref:HAD-IIA family hydrolase n=1 Tax=Iodobacter arcticus TaxID=590593 RepID=A0ABW2QWP2_9NEIS
MSNWIALAKKNVFLIDLDGVVYKGSKPVDGAIEAIQRLREAGKKIIYLTNNSARSPLSIRNKLEGMGIACAENELLTSAEVACQAVKKDSLDGQKGVYVVGSSGLRDLVVNHGLKLATHDQCGAVLVGLDLELSYETISNALQAITNGALLIACNSDANYPSDKGALLPGCGAMLGAIEGAAGIRCNYLFGKPNKLMLQVALERIGGVLNECVVIGDTLESDILMANNANAESIYIDNDQWHHDSDIVRSFSSKSLIAAVNSMGI